MEILSSSWNLYGRDYLIVKYKVLEIPPGGSVGASVRAHAGVQRPKDFTSPLPENAKSWIF